MKKPIIVLTSLVMGVIVLSLVQVVIATKLSTTGVDLAKIQGELEVVKKDNSLLSENLYDASSYAKIASKAGELGFVDKHENYVVTSEVHVAKN